MYENRRIGQYVAMQKQKVYYPAPSILRNFLIKKYKGECYYCQRQVESEGPRRATIEHLTPKSRGGNWTLKNVRLACQRCNQIVGDLPRKHKKYIRYKAIERRKASLIKPQDNEKTMDDGLFAPKGIDAFPDVNSRIQKCGFLKWRIYVWQNGNYSVYMSKMYSLWDLIKVLFNL